MISLKVRYQDEFGFILCFPSFCETNERKKHLKKSHDYSPLQTIMALLENLNFNKKCFFWKYSSPLCNTTKSRHFLSRAAETRSKEWEVLRWSLSLLPGKKTQRCLINVDRIIKIFQIIFLHWDTIEFFTNKKIQQIHISLSKNMVNISCISISFGFYDY